MDYREILGEGAQVITSGHAQPSPCSHPVTFYSVHKLHYIIHLSYTGKNG